LINANPLSDLFRGTRSARSSDESNFAHSTGSSYG
jgi:hypothetical protein